MPNMISISKYSELGDEDLSDLASASNDSNLIKDELLDLLYNPNRGTTHCMANNWSENKINPDIQRL